MDGRLLIRGMMKPYYQDEWVTQYCSDALTALRGLEGDTVDLLVTDPPYGIGFMGKDWDKALPDKDIWAECLRVLKPGSFAFVMSIPRADCLSRMIISLEDAGFNVGFSPIYWAYASGFPKAQNIGKAVDKRGGISVGWFGEWLRKWRKSKGFSSNDIGALFPSKTGKPTGCVRNWELGLNMPTPKEFSTICRHYNLPFESIEEAEREIVGKQKNAMSGWNIDGSTKFIDRDITLAETPQAKALDGSYGGFQPKPAVEVIIVCMKPLSEKTFVDQALKNRKGITWLDDCRIPYESEDSIKDKNPHTHRENSRQYTEIYGEYQESSYSLPAGRFPANLLVSDDVLNDGRVSKSNIRSVPEADIGDYQSKQYNDYGAYRPKQYEAGHTDSGSFSRYFDLDKWWAKTFPFLIVPKASKGEKNKGLENTPIIPCSALGINNDPGFRNVQGRSGDNKTHNSHPTVKPLKLMSYLITLGSRAGDTVVDPFGGSGTTALASKLLSRKCIISEIEEKYCEIAAKRCSQLVMRLDI